MSFYSVVGSLPILQFREGGGGVKAGGRGEGKESRNFSDTKKHDLNLYMKEESQYEPGRNMRAFACAPDFAAFQAVSIIYIYIFFQS